MTEKDPLDKLIVDESENPNISLLAGLVSPYLRFDKKSGEIIFNEEFYKLKDWQKVLIYLLGRKVIFVKKLQKDFDEKITPKKISEILNIESKHIRTYASRELKGLIKSEKGKYSVPNY
ncbi:MAG: hypothetical protein J7J38_00340, partial [Candidatus Aenigmarchaeota archaeon]|nr:hypothetical protein [Candidatus Aenigmarchaeota archaeon]